VIPALEKGFKRDSLTWNIAADGLRIDYTVVDRQIETAAPWPAAKMTVRHSENTTTLGTSFEAECHVSLSGHPGADKRQLLALGIRVLENRFCKLNEISADNAVLPLAFGIVDNHGERNEVELYLKIQHTVNWKAGGDNPAKNYLGTPVGKLGTTLDDFSIKDRVAGTYLADTSWVPNPWGYDAGGDARKSQIARLAMYCFCQTPCEDNHYIYQGTAPSETAKKPSTKSDTTVYETSSPISIDPSASATTKVSSAGQNALFTHASSETTIQIDPLRVQLPRAIDPASWNGKDDTCVFVALGGPQATLTYHVECERVGQWPSVPEPLPSFNDSATNMKGQLLSAVLSPLPPTLDPTATKPVFRISAKIVFGLNRPPLRNEKIPLGILQWTAYTPSQTAITLAGLYAEAQPFSQSGSRSASGAKY
jgi:hypothetical protein